MTPVLFALIVTLLAANDSFAQTAQSVLEQRFDGTLARETACSFLLDTRKRAEVEGRLDFVANVESVGNDASPSLVARISNGPAYAVRRIHFTGHRNINDGTIRRSLRMFERDMLNVQRLRSGIARINGLGVFLPVTLEDVIVTRVNDGATVDLTIQLQERKRRWWSISGVPVLSINPLQASLASRLPPWGRGIFEMATYFVSLNMVGFGKPFFALERSVIPGQEWLSGFAITPALSPRAMATHYGRTHALYAAGRMLEFKVDDTIAVDMRSAAGSQSTTLVCKPTKPRLWWLCVAARQALALF